MGVECGSRTNAESSVRTSCKQTFSISYVFNEKRLLLLLLLLLLLWYQ